MHISTLLLCTITSLCGEAGPNHRPLELLFRVQEILHSIKIFSIRPATRTSPRLACILLTSRKASDKVSSLVVVQLRRALREGLDEKIRGHFAGVHLDRRDAWRDFR